MEKPMDADDAALGAASRYLLEVVEFGSKLGAKAAYAFVVDGHKGTGGCPVVIGSFSHEEYLDRCKRLVALLRRSAALLERDVGIDRGLIDGFYWVRRAGVLTFAEKRGMGWRVAGHLEWLTAAEMGEAFEAISGPIRPPAVTPAPLEPRE